MDENELQDIKKNDLSNHIRNKHNLQNYRLSKNKVIRMSLYSLILIVFGIILIILNFEQNSEKVLKSNFTSLEGNDLLSSKNSITNKHMLNSNIKSYISNENYSTNSKYKKLKFRLLEQQLSSFDSNYLELNKFINSILYGSIVSLLLIIFSFIILKIKNMTADSKKVFYYINCIVFSFLNTLLIKIFYILLTKKFENDFTKINLLTTFGTFSLSSFYICLVDYNFKINSLTMLMMNGIFCIFTRSYLVINILNILLNFLNDLFILLFNLIFERLNVKRYIYSYLYTSSQNELMSTLSFLDYGFISINENMDPVFNNYFLKALFKNEDFVLLKNNRKFNNMKEKEIIDYLKLNYEDILKFKLFVFLFENLFTDINNEIFRSNLRYNKSYLTNNLTNSLKRNANKQKNIHLKEKINNGTNKNIMNTNSDKDNIPCFREIKKPFNLNNLSKLENFLISNRLILINLIKYSKELSFDIKEQDTRAQIIFENKEQNLKLSRNNTSRTKINKIKEKVFEGSFIRSGSKNSDSKNPKFDKSYSRRLYSLIDYKEKNEIPSSKNYNFVKSQSNFPNFNNVENSQNDSKLSLFKKKFFNRYNTLENKSISDFQTKTLTELQYKKRNKLNSKKKKKRLLYNKDDIMKMNLNIMYDFLKKLKNYLTYNYIEKSNFLSSSSNKILSDKDININTGNIPYNLFYLKKNELFNKIDIMVKSSNNNILKKQTFKSDNKKQTVNFESNNFKSISSLGMEKNFIISEEERECEISLLDKNKENLNNKVFNENSLAIFTNLQNKISHELLNPLLNLINYLKDSKNYLKDDETTPVNNNNLYISYKHNLNNKSRNSINNSSSRNFKDNSNTNSNLTLSEFIKKNKRNSFVSELSNNISNHNEYFPIKRSNPLNSTYLNTIIENNQDNICFNNNENALSNIFSKSSYSHLISNLKKSQNISKIIKYIADDIISILNFNYESLKKSQNLYAINEQRESSNLTDKDLKKVCLLNQILEGKNEKNISLNKINNFSIDKSLDKTANNKECGNSINFKKLIFDENETPTSNNLKSKGYIIFREESSNTRIILKGEEIDLCKKMELLNFEFGNKIDKKYFIKVINDTRIQKKLLKESLIMNKNSNIVKKTESLIEKNYESNNEENINKSFLDSKRMNTDQKMKNCNQILNTSFAKNYQKMYYKILIDKLVRDTSNSFKGNQNKMNEMKNISHSLITESHYTKINVKKIIRKIIKVVKTKLSLLNKNIQIKVKYLSKNEKNGDVYKSSNLTSSKLKENECINYNVSNVMTDLNPKTPQEEKNEFFIFSNEDLIQQSLFNILSNSIKFTRVGKIVVEISNEEKNLIMKIKDTGIGIEYQTFYKLGEPFVKSEKANNIYGMGMGLYICSNNIKSIKGKIELITCEEMGTTIILMIPNNSDQILDKNLINFNYNSKERSNEKSLMKISGKLNMINKNETLNKMNYYSTNNNVLSSNLNNNKKINCNNTTSKINEQILNNINPYNHNENESKNPLKRKSTQNIESIKNNNPQNLYNNRFIMCNPNTIINNLNQSNLFGNIAIINGDCNNNFNNKEINLKNSPININIYNNYKGLINNSNYTEESHSVIKNIPLMIENDHNTISDEYLNKEKRPFTKKKSSNSSNSKYRKKKSLSNIIKPYIRKNLGISENSKKQPNLNSSYRTFSEIKNRLDNSRLNNENRNRRYSNKTDYYQIELSMSQDKSIDYSFNHKKDNNSNLHRDDLNKYSQRNYKFITAIKQDSSISQNSELNNKSKNNTECHMSINNSIRRESAVKSSSRKDTLTNSAIDINLKQHLISLSRFYDNQNLSSNIHISNINSCTNKNSSKNLNDVKLNTRTNEPNLMNENNNNFNYENAMKNLNNMMTYKISQTESNIEEKYNKEGTFSYNNLPNNTNGKPSHRNDPPKSNFNQSLNIIDNESGTIRINKEEVEQTEKEENKNSTTQQILFIDHNNENIYSENENEIYNIAEKSILRILIVDDEVIIRKSHKKLFEKYFAQHSKTNFLIEECEDGIECLYKIYLGYKQNIQYDIIVTDETMNFLSGSRLANMIYELKKDSIINDILVFVVSSYKSNYFNPKNKDIIFANCFNKPLTKQNIELLLQIYSVSDI